MLDEPERADPCTAFYGEQITRLLSEVNVRTVEAVVRPSAAEDTAGALAFTVHGDKPFDALALPAGDALVLAFDNAVGLGLGDRPQ